MSDDNKLVLIAVTHDQAKILLMHTESTIRLVLSIDQDLKSVRDFKILIEDIQSQLIEQGVSIQTLSA